MLLQVRAWRLGHETVQIQVLERLEYEGLLSEAVRGFSELARPTRKLRKISSYTLKGLGFRV